MPWLEGTVQPYARALRGWRDVTKDISYEPRSIQFRIDLWLLARAIEIRWPSRITRVPGSALVGGIALSFRSWELFVLTLVLQVGMLPLASAFHRITFAGAFVNFAAVPLTAIIVPLGFCALISGFLWAVLGKLLAVPLSLVREKEKYLWSTKREENDFRWTKCRGSFCDRKVREPMQLQRQRTMIR